MIAVLRVSMKQEKKAIEVKITLKCLAAFKETEL
jgi:hypothetical protein